MTVLAGNFAANYPRFPMSEDEPVQITNGPSDFATENATRVADGKAEVRPLTFSELAEFFHEFAETNMEAAVTG